jgi:general nucleoside transport system ATP-binding protein
LSSPRLREVGETGEAELDPAVELRHIVKRFPGVVANRDVNLQVAQGEIHAIVGENGAGKSTLMKILYGMQHPDEGEIIVEGKRRTFRSPSDAIAVGIGMVHQHFMLADNLTVAENVIVGSEPTTAGVISFAQARRRINELAEQIGFWISPNKLVEDLGVGERQRVEILKVLYRGARILILDEPTAVLVPQEVDELFRNLAELKRSGVTIIFISHKLDEVLAVADNITVIRQGTTVRTVSRGEVTARQLAELMVGSELPTPETRKSTVAEEIELSVDNLVVADPAGRTVVDDVTFDIHRGEIVGIAGVEGNGQSELIEAILGLEPASGEVRLKDANVSTWTTRARRDAGIGYVPEDRQRDGLLLEASLWENAMLGHQTMAPFAHGLWVDRRNSKARAVEICRDYDVRTPSIGVAAFALSGGNQQKLIVGREMSARPQVLVAAHPTRGVDVGAQAAIWDQLREARRDGLGVLLVSSDLEELIGLSDTLYVMYRGQLVAKVDPTTVTPEELGSYMTGAKTDSTS